MWRNLYPELDGKTLAPKFSIGDRVRITKKKKTFDKGYTQRWTKEVFTISKIQLTIPVTYKSRLLIITERKFKVRFTHNNFKRRNKTYLG